MLFLVKDLVIGILSRVRYIQVSIFGKIRVLTPARILHFEITVASERGINTTPHIEHHTFVFHVFFLLQAMHADISPKKSTAQTQV